MAQSVNDFNESPSVHVDPLPGRQGGPVDMAAEPTPPSGRHPAARFFARARSRGAASVFTIRSFGRIGSPNVPPGCMTVPRLCSRRLLVTAMAAWGLFVVQVAPVPAAAESSTPLQWLATRFTQVAITVLQEEPVLVEALDGAVVLCRLAVEADPQSSDAWRTLLKVAQLAERPQLQARALGMVARLDPHDEVVRLAYVHNAIDRYQTVEERVAMYERLLSPELRQRLGAAVSSRLAGDVALLLYRQGDVEAYGRWLAEAVALDPANRAAAASAAGFFRMRVEDPYAEAQLLVALLLADPISVTTQTALAQLLLEQGAYVGAQRLYRMTIRLDDKEGRAPTSGLLADYAVAQWGAGDAAGAIQTIQERQGKVDQAHRDQVSLQNPTLTLLELAELPPAPLSRTLATVRAAILNRLGDDQAGPALRGALAAHVANIEAMAAAEDPVGDLIAQANLEAAWVAMWLAGNDTDEAVGFLEAAAGLGPQGRLPELQRVISEGWLALGQGDSLRAVQLLAPIAEQDSSARLGLSLAQLQRGRRGNAARGLLAVVRDQPGSVMGVWASDLLAQLVGQRPGPTPEAARMEELVAAIPAVVDRFIDEPTLAVSLRLRLAKTTFAPYEPIVLNLEITNNAPFPLAMDGGGPIRPSVAILTTASVSNRPEVGVISPLIVDIDRRLRLEPFQQLVIPVDLRRSDLEAVLNAYPLAGATVRVKVVLNYMVSTAGVVQPGHLGSEVQSPTLRIDGVRAVRSALYPPFSIDGVKEWVKESISAILDPDTVEDLKTMALLSHVVAKVRLPGLGQELSDAEAALAEGFGKLDGPSRAWLLGVMPSAERLDPLRAMASQQTDKQVRISYLLYCLTGPDDPVLKAAKNGDDPDVRGVAELMEFGTGRPANSGE